MQKTCKKAAYTTENIGTSRDHGSLKDFKTKIEYQERHLKIAKEQGDRREEGRAYDSLGITYLLLGDYKTAKDYLECQIKIFKELGDRLREGRAYGNLGNAHYSLGDFKTARDCYQRRLEIAKELGDRSGEGELYSILATPIKVWEILKQPMTTMNAN